MGEQRRRFTKSERETVYRKTSGQCAYCGKKITLDEMGIE